MNLSVVAIFWVQEAAGKFICSLNSVFWKFFILIDQFERNQKGLWIYSMNSLKERVPFRSTSALRICSFHHPTSPCSILFFAVENI